MTPEEVLDFYNRVVDIIENISYKQDYDILVDIDPVSGQRVFIQVKCYRKDTVTGEWGYGKGGKLYLSPYMSDQEIVQNTFGLYKSYEEHECREFFMYKGKRIYGPHISLEALLEVADRTTYRDKQG